ncbi:MAG: 30S ribosomal protein S4 [bacterium]|nr:30S ribosomal protein S4 [bacterium]
MPISRPKEKLERRIGEKLFLKGERSFSQKSAIVKRPYPPGVHGKKKRRGRSEYGVQLKEKQKVRYIYGINNGKLKKYYTEALANKGKSTADTIAELLERRLDNVVFRFGFTISRSVARHLVSHGHILVNGKRVRQPSLRVRIGDAIALKESELSSPLYQDLNARLKKYIPPEWLELADNKHEGRVVRLPNIGDTMTQQNMPLVVEYYSK